MRKCIDLESQPGFQNIYAPQMQQAIDRGLAGHSGDPKNIDWGYDLPKPQTEPVIRPGDIPRVEPKPPEPLDPSMPDPVNTTGPYWDTLFNRYAIQPVRKLINLFPTPTIQGGSKDEGSFNPFSGKGNWGLIDTPKGYGGYDIHVLYHEYGHAIDHIGGMLENDSKNPLKETSMELLDGMQKDGIRLGWIVNDSAMYDYIEKNGLHFVIKGSRKINIAKGSNKAEAESKMKPGDRFRILEYLVTQVKKDLNKANLSKDPVKIRRAKDEAKKINAVFDADTKRQKDAQDFVKELVAISKQMKKSMPDYDATGMNEHVGAFTDIIDAISGGEIFDRETAEMSQNIYRLGSYGVHPHGYYSGRQTKVGIVRNHNMDTIMEYRRAEVWAQLFLFYAHDGGKTKNTQILEHAKKTMPETYKAFETALQRLMTIPQSVIDDSKFHRHT